MIQLPVEVAASAWTATNTSPSLPGCQRSLTSNTWSTFVVQDKENQSIWVRQPAKSQSQQVLMQMSTLKLQPAANDQEGPFNQTEQLLEVSCI